jgi:hypothetical protein
MSKPRCFLIEPCTNVNTAPASKHGPVLVLFPRGSRRASIWSDEFRQEILAALDAHAYDPANDHIVIAGHMIPVTIMIGTLVQRFGEISVLFYDAPSRDYVAYSMKDIAYGQEHASGNRKAV